MYYRALRCLLLCALPLLHGCKPTVDKDHLASGQAFLAAHDAAAALIEFRNAVQKDPASARARFLLGQVLLDTGDTAGASLQLRKAGEAGFEEAQVAPLLARALLLSGEDKQVIERYGLSRLGIATAQAEVQAAVATAYAHEGELGKAQKALAGALEADPDNASARLLAAELMARRGDNAGALAALDALTRRQPSMADAWLLKGQIESRASEDKASAVASLRRALAVRPDLVPAHEGIIVMALRSGDLATADAQVQEMLKVRPNHPRTRYFLAQTAFLRKDYASARAVTQELLRTSPTDPAVLELAGATAYSSKDYGTSERYLTQALQVAPTAMMTRLLLARLHLRAGHPDQGLAVLQPLLAAAGPSPRALTLAGEAEMLLGHPAVAMRYLKQAAAAGPADLELGIQLAMGELSVGGSSDQALSSLRALSARQGAVTADLAIISEHLRNGQFARALQALDGLARKQPDTAFIPYLRGRIQWQANDADSARQSFEKALELDRTYFPAVVTLAALDLAQKGPKEARQRFDRLLEVEPNHPGALLAIANLLIRTGGDPVDIGSLLDRAIAANPSAPEPRLRRVDQALATGDVKSALVAARDAAGVLPNSADVQFALARAQSAAGDSQQALRSYARLALLEPKSPRSALALADMHLGLHDPAAAGQDLRRALELVPDLLVAQQKLVELALVDGRPEDALPVVRQVKQQRPKDPAGFLLEGRLEASRKNWNAAIDQFRKGSVLDRTGQLAVQLHRTYLLAGRGAEADRFASAWSSEHPNDVAMAVHLGDVAVASQNFVQAEVQYRRALKADPANALAMNNVAWALLKQGKPGALALAQEANRLLPGRPPFMDTLASALLAEDRLAQALAVERQAVEAAPGDPSMRLNLARLYAKAGEKTQAREHLQIISAQSPAVPERAQALEMLDQLAL